MKYESFACPECGVVIDVEEGNTSTTCPHCDTGLEWCDECGEWKNADEMTTVKSGERVCEDCLDEYFCWCEKCETYNRIDHFETVKTDYNTEEYWCGDCVDDYAERCQDCGDYMSPGYATEVRGGGYVCDNCRGDCYYYCEHCDEYVHEDDWDYDNDCCYDCTPDSRVGRYHENNGYWVHFGDCLPRWRGVWRGLGIELEIDRNNRDDEEESDLVDELADIAGDHIYFERDGSLDNGFEIITQPHTEAAFNEIDWEAILDACKRHGYTSHDAGTCGLHVHISRTMFGSNTRIADNNIAKLLHFYNHYYEDIVKVSRRTLKAAEEWAARYDGATDRKRTADIVKHKYTAGRYHAVNITNTNTVEIRIMRGTLNHASFAACIDFALKTAQNARRIKWADIDNAELWLRGISDNTREYINARGAFACV